MRPRPGLRPVGESGPCVVCGGYGCHHLITRQVPFGAPLPPLRRPFMVTTLVMNPEHPDVVLYGGGDLIEHDEAVRLGLTTDSDLPEQPPEGARKGRRRARRPSGDTSRHLAEDRSRGHVSDREDRDAGQR